MITVHGTGLNPLTILWADFGDPSSADSMDINYVYMTGTEMQIVAAGEPVTVDRGHRSDERQDTGRPVQLRSGHVRAHATLMMSPAGVAKPADLVRGATILGPPRGGAVW